LLAEIFINVDFMAEAGRSVLKTTALATVEVLSLAAKNYFYSAGSLLFSLSLAQVSLAPNWGF